MPALTLHSRSEASDLQVCQSTVPTFPFLLSLARTSNALPVSPLVKWSVGLRIPHFFSSYLIIKFSKIGMNYAEKSV